MVLEIRIMVTLKGEVGVNRPTGRFWSESEILLLDLSANYMGAFCRNSSCYRVVIHAVLYTSIKSLLQN